MKIDISEYLVVSKYVKGQGHKHVNEYFMSVGKNDCPARSEIDEN